MQAIESSDMPEESSVPAFRVAVAGEFNAGKSSLINLMRRREELPVGVTWSRQPPVACDLTDKVTLVEVPIDEDGELSSAARKELDRADMLIWCTVAQRAWCLTEADLIATLPDRLFRNAVIAVTRSDQLSPEAREKVRTRVARMTEDRFPTLVMVDARPGSASAGETRWTEAGGRELTEAVQRASSAPRPQPTLVLTEPVVAPVPEEPVPAASCEPASPAARWTESCAEVVSLAEGGVLPLGRVFDEIRQRLDRMREEDLAFDRAFLLLDRLQTAPDRDSWAWDLAVQLRDRVPTGEKHS